MASVPEGAAAQWLYKPELTTYADNLGLLEKQSPIFTLKLADSLVDVAKNGGLTMRIKLMSAVTGKT